MDRYMLAAIHFAEGQIPCRPTENDCSANPPEKEKEKEKKNGRPAGPNERFDSLPRVPPINQ